MAKKKHIRTDPRCHPVDTHILEHIADQPASGSGESSYITGRIQSMAREILIYRKKEEERCGLLFGSAASLQ